jgi:hypothetical protein
MTQVTRIAPCTLLAGPLAAAPALARKHDGLASTTAPMTRDRTLSNDILPCPLQLSEKGHGLPARAMEPALQNLPSQP